MSNAETLKFCTRGRHHVRVSKFRLRHNSHTRMPWCEDCKKEYDKITVAAKRAAQALARVRDQGEKK